jgi:hypothetical protein
MKQILFFATPSDIVPVLKLVQSHGPLKFVEAGVLDHADRPAYCDVADIPCPGVATHETGNRSVGYLIGHRELAIPNRSYMTRKSEARWALFNGDIEGTVLLSMGGLWRTNVLLPGLIDTVHKDAAALQLMKWFLSALKAEGFQKIRHWWVGKEAMSMLKSGKRLATLAEQSPPEFDLKLPEEPLRQPTAGSGLKRNTSPPS